MQRTIIATPNAPKPGGPYNQAVCAGGLVFIAGFGPRDPATRRIIGEGIAEQTEHVLRNIESVLHERGLGLGDLLQVTAYLQHPSRDKAAFNETYARVVPSPWPARATIGAELAGFLIEMDAIALDRRSA